MVYTDGCVSRASFLFSSSLLARALSPTPLILVILRLWYVTTVCIGAGAVAIGTISVELSTREGREKSEAGPFVGLKSGNPSYRESALEY